MKNIRIKTSLLLVFLLSSFSLQAIQSSTANVCTALVAAACAGCSYQVMPKLPTYIQPFALVTGISSAITVVTYYNLHQLTPDGRIKKAKNLLKKLSHHPLARIHFDNDQSFFDAVHDVYLTDDLPLISAYNCLIDLVPTMHSIFRLIKKASVQVNKNSVLQKKCHASLLRAKKLFRNISDAIKRIRNHKDYLSQLTIYKESLSHEQQTIAQQQIANAHHDIAVAKQGSTVLKWLKFFFGRK